MRVTSVRAALFGIGCRGGALLPLQPPPLADSSQTLSTTAAGHNAADAGHRPPRGSNQDIVVTARRRNELLLDVPVAVTAYSGEQLDRQGALDITDVADTTPNVTLEVSRGTNSTLTPFIRGIGQQDPVAGFEQGVGLYLDDVYLQPPAGSRSRHLRRRADRSAARSAGHPLRPQHDRRRDQICDTQNSDRTALISASATNLGTLWPGRRDRFRFDAADRRRCSIGASGRAAEQYWFRQKPHDRPEQL